jgi:alpha-amylase
MTRRISLVFGIHIHQPVGNFEFTFEDAYQKSYRPFLETMAEAPWFPFTFHCTGPLIDFLVEKHPEYLDLLKAMTERGQVELMTGGYYEPIMPIVPDRDKKGQIRKLSRYLRDRFGQSPQGMWLAERVWEPHLARPLSQAGVRYLTMDDSHFVAAGLQKDHLHGYYQTEEQGSSLAVFPISERLRYLIPFRQPEETVEYLRGLATPGGERLLVIADDGEKFGVWPDTHEWVYTKGWLKRFLDTMEQHRDWIRLLTFDQALREHRSLGPVYIPTASYTEMMEWVLPPEQTNELEALWEDERYERCRPYLRGGFWRNYLVKYRESNNLHKRMLLVSRKVHGMRGAEKERALEFLWAAQCNCGYWHGVFGGLYLNHIRTAIYTNLLEAEVLADAEGTGDGDRIRLDVTDFYRDGGHCLLASTPVLNLYFDLDRGGHLFELDHKPRKFNLLNTLTRRKEAYHQRLLEGKRKDQGNGESARSIHEMVIVKEEGLEKRLQYDWYRRSAFIDHFLGSGADLTGFRQADYPESGDFVNHPYEVEWEETGDHVLVTFSREGEISSDSGAHPVLVERILSLRAGSGDVGVDYRVTSRSDSMVRTRFGVEFGFAMQAGDTPDRYYRFAGEDTRTRLGEEGTRSGLEWVSLTEEWVGVEARVEFGEPFDLWFFPIETVSSSEAGFERTYQSSVILPHWNLDLPPGGKWSVRGKLSLIDLKK